MQLYINRTLCSNCPPLGLDAILFDAISEQGKSLSDSDLFEHALLLNVRISCEAFWVFNFISKVQYVL